jgi:hypothetical protein
MNLYESLIHAFETLGWDPSDDIKLEIGGTQVSGIDQPEGYNEKWSSPRGHRKYNKDAFIVFKNKTRDPWVPSVAPVVEEQTNEV